MTKLEFANKFIFQWFFVRLTRCRERMIDEVEYYECSLLLDGTYGIGGTVKKEHYEQWYAIQYWIVPLTGWSSNFIFLGRKRFKRITKRKIV